MSFNLFSRAGAAVLVAATCASAASIQGPSSSATPYVVGAQPGVVSKSILAVGDSVPSPDGAAAYRMAGIPDGLGAFDNGDGTFTLLMNHEIRTGQGAVRAHGADGAFVSKWIIRKGSLEVVSGEDLIREIALWSPATNDYAAPARGVALNRLCSADLAAPSAFFDSATGLGYDGRLFMNGEEAGTEGRAFAHGLDGTSWELPRLGKFSWENSVPSPGAGASTVVVGLDDTSGGQLYVYVGRKANEGSPVDRAGLTGGTLYGVKVAAFPEEDETTGIPSGTVFSLHSFGDVANRTGAWLEAESNANGLTAFRRPEDGAWDPNRPNDFYFVTTDRFDGFSRLWRLRFHDVRNPALGGTIAMLLDGTERPQMMDNLTVSDRGRVLIQEDPGGNPHLAKIWQYDIASGSLDLVAQHDPERFVPGAPEFLTFDEESSGIIDVSSILGAGWFLLDVQAHYALPGELVQGGQLLAIHVPPGRR